jgi:hypothetical protein
MTQDSSHFEITNEDNAHHFIRYQGYCSLWIHSTRPKHLTKFIIWKYWSDYLKLCVRKGQNFGPTIVFSIMTMVQLTRRCQAVSGPKINYWSETPITFPWFGSEWLVAVPKNKSALKGWKFQDTEDIPKKKKKSDDGTDSCSTTEVPKMAAASSS